MITTYSKFWIILDYVGHNVQAMPIWCKNILIMFDSILDVWDGIFRLWPTPNRKNCLFSKNTSIIIINVSFTHSLFIHFHLVSLTNTRFINRQIDVILVFRLRVSICFNIWTRLLTVWLKSTIGTYKSINFKIGGVKLIII